MAIEHPERATWKRQWSPAAQSGTLKWLETVTKEKPAVTELELWTVKKDKRTLRCGRTRRSAFTPFGAATSLFTSASPGPRRRSVTKRLRAGRQERSRALVTATGERRCESRDGEAAGEPPNQPPVASMAGTGGNSSSVFDDDFPVH